MVRPDRVERPTFWFVAKCFYKSAEQVPNVRFEPFYMARAFQLLQNGLAQF